MDPDRQDTTWHSFLGASACVFLCAMAIAVFQVSAALFLGIIIVAVFVGASTLIVATGMRRYWICRGEAELILARAEAQRIGSRVRYLISLARQVGTVLADSGDVVEAHSVLRKRILNGVESSSAQDGSDFSSSLS